MAVDGINLYRSKSSPDGYLGTPNVLVNLVEAI